MEKIVLIKTLAELKDLELYLQDKEFVAFDTETTGLSKESQVIGFSICADVELGYYVILSAWDLASSQLIQKETLTEAPSFLEKLKKKKLIMHNAIFDCMIVNSNFNVDLMPSLHTDTMILGHLLNENRSNGLKERGVELYGEDATKERDIMKDSVLKNGGKLTKEVYELYKADADLIAYYGAKDAILTLKLFYNDVPILVEEGLDSFFYDDESMPLLRGPTYQLNTEGLRIDPNKLSQLKSILEADCLAAKSFIHNEIKDLVKKKYAGTRPNNTFNIGSSKQLAWLLFFELDNEFNILTKEGKNLCKALELKIPYVYSAKKDFIRTCIENKGKIYEDGKWNYKTKKISRPKKIGDPWNYLACGKESLQKLAKKYKWVEKLLEYAKNLKLLNTYVEGIQKRMQYNIIRPGFLQHGTTSGRYSSRNPNFQNLPRDDKRVKGCIISRPGKIFVGADYSQLEPRVFASFSKDERLLNSFKQGDDFYSVIGIEVFEKHGCSLKKDDKNSFAKLYPELRNISKVVALSSTYGTTAAKMAPSVGKSINEAQAIIHSYFQKFPSVRDLMLDAHEDAKQHGVVYNLFGRPRRIPEAKNIEQIYGVASHDELPYNIRNILNLAINHKIQSTGASIMNRAAIAITKECSKRATVNKSFNDVKLVLQVHDELILEGPEHLMDEMCLILKTCMENTVKLPGVDLIADPKVAINLADLK